MISEQYKAMLSGKSVIRQLSERAAVMKQDIGAENVFDFSLGNLWRIVSVQGVCRYDNLLSLSDCSQLHILL